MLLILESKYWDAICLQEVTTSNLDASIVIKGHEMFLSHAFGARRRSAVILHRRWAGAWRKALPNYYGIL
eukprot:1608548-Karenia_brevis.AAC.1